MMNPEIEEGIGRINGLRLYKGQSPGRLLERKKGTESPDMI